MGSDKIRVIALDKDNVEVGIHNSVESYDEGSGKLYATAVIPIEDLGRAIDAAQKDRKQRKKDRTAAYGDPKGFAPNIDASHPSADSSFRSEDRPPIRISSDTNPEPAAPVPLPETAETAGGVERRPDGLAAVPGNTQFDKAPGPNIEEPPEGVAQPKPDPDAPSAYPSLTAAADGSEPATSSTGADPTPVSPAEAETAKEAAPKPATETKSSKKSTSRTSTSKTSTKESGGKVV